MLVFETYGVFLRRILDEPELQGVGAVVLDEFHERSLECWLKALKSRRRPDLRLLVMSATLDGGELLRYLPGAARLNVPGRLFPVEVRHLPLEAREGPAQGALRAIKLLHREGFGGSALVFMPGVREIRASLASLAPFCREKGLLLQALHGSMELSEQQKVLGAPPDEPRVIVATNVAETSLTIPGVTKVVDSGLHLIAGYSPERDINTLYLARISRGNAEQRAGRAGRLAPGRCVRLWAKSEDASMPKAVLPEVMRLELSSLFLQAASLPEAVNWLTPPKEGAWIRAGRLLRRLDAVDEHARITARGRALLRYPLAPRLAAALERARSLGSQAYERACAMAAVFECVAERRHGDAAELGSLAEDLIAGRGESLGRPPSSSGG